MKKTEIQQYNNIKKKINETNDYDGALIPKIYPNNYIDTNFLNEFESSRYIIYENVGNITLKEWTDKIADSTINKNERKKSVDFIFKKIKNFILAIHNDSKSPSVYHNDLHNKNILLLVNNHDITNIKEVYIIDFQILNYIRPSVYKIMLKNMYYNIPVKLHDYDLNFTELNQYKIKRKLLI